MNPSVTLEQTARPRESTGGPAARGAHPHQPSRRVVIALLALGALFGVGVLLGGDDLTLFAVLALIPLAGMILYRPVVGGLCVVWAAHC